MGGKTQGYSKRMSGHFILSTNKRTYIKFHIKTLKIAPTCFDPKIILGGRYVVSC